MDPHPFFFKINTLKFNFVKMSRNIWYTTIIFKELPKENNYPIVEISPNLVTLFILWVKYLTVHKDIVVGLLAKKSNTYLFIKI
jgi:hypothetical protein